MNIHFLSEKSILLDFSSPRGVTTLGCEFHSQAGLASVTVLKILTDTDTNTFIRYQIFPILVPRFDQQQNVNECKRGW